MIEYPSSRCLDSPHRGHHFLCVLPPFVWRCKYCWKAKWQPASTAEAIKFTGQIDKLGLAEAYKRKLQKLPEIAKLLEKMEEIRLLRRTLSEEELSKVIYAMFKPYQRRDPPAPAMNLGYRKKHAGFAVQA